MKTSKPCEFISYTSSFIDVRSPQEFSSGHIPGAINIPLLSNEEHALIGTIYKKESPQKAFEYAKALVLPKMPSLLSLFSSYKLTSPLNIYCFRGGLRSQCTAEALETLGWKVTTLEKGYKEYRNYILKKLEKLSDFTLIVLGGKAGSGKTEILRALKKLGAQILDLEFLAHHRGSLFGHLEQQPSYEQFENNIVHETLPFSSDLPIFIEQESRMLGSCKIPDSLFKKMKESSTLWIEKPLEERIEQLCFDYQNMTKEVVLKALDKLSKRIGRDLTKKILNYFEEDQKTKGLALLLNYYDLSYEHFLKKYQIPISKRLYYTGNHHESIARQIISLSYKKLHE